MPFINQHRSFLTTVSVRGIVPFDVQFYGLRPGDISEAEGYEIVSEVLHRRNIIKAGVDFFMSPPRHDPVTARTYRNQGRMPA